MSEAEKSASKTLTLSWRDAAQQIRRRPTLLWGLLAIPIGLYGGSRLHDWQSARSAAPAVAPTADGHPAGGAPSRSAEDALQLRRMRERRHRDLLREKASLEAKLTALQQQEKAAHPSTTTTAGGAVPPAPA
ncbi:hypothetical protein THASP1DRAFT_29015 [Thamnocephalis sphaerospora]|uniref:Uncharacterized protein n=1 Tax=Thamnocephalis sphaerospora TaxID=78915 RepID=A0A4P9XST3_9FUNG|nr:hypothetical protein THASP1DRAFT_29015 [Thamnocephalis sphaerospora]|eukprot:RKP09193.1 hypothetical protein THASP1DRAFT_29015 [Thamnocephalis sphaerospora]